MVADLEFCSFDPSLRQHDSAEISDYERFQFFEVAVVEHDFDDLS